MTAPSATTPTRVVARFDRGLGARVVRRVPLRYADGADPAVDRPPHVRAGSGLAWVDAPSGRRLAVVQDDAHFVALVDPADGSAHAVVLPPGPEGLRQFDDARGNKARKLDLEAVVVVPDAASGAAMLVAIGSGSLPRREHAVLVRGLALGAPDVREVHLAALYAALRAEPAFAGSEMNVEGAVFLPHVDGGVLRLFGRGNGAARDGTLPLDATCDLAWPALRAHLDAPGLTPPPAPTRVRQYALGTIDDVPLGFTDAAARDDGSLIYTAAAEASPDAVRDGTVAGSALGVLTADGSEARWTVLRDADGAPFAAKVEGIALAPDDARHAWIVVDRDTHDAPSELCLVMLDGAW